MCYRAGVPSLYAAYPLVVWCCPAAAIPCVPNVCPLTAHLSVPYPRESISSPLVWMLWGLSAVHLTVYLRHTTATGDTLCWCPLHAVASSAA